MTTTTTPSGRGPAKAGERVLAPDLARGFMLLLIVLANTVFYLWGAERSPGSAHPVDGSVADKITQVVLIAGVEMRSYPMFAFLFGYGIVQLLSRQLATGTTERDARALLRRRHLWLLVFGAAHAALLWMGDILAAYGLTGLVLCWLFLRRSDRVLLVWSGVLGGLVVTLSLALVVLTALAPEGAAGGAPLDYVPILTSNISETSYLASVPARLPAWLFLVVVQGFVLLVLPVSMLLGFWAARRRVLEEPGQHLRLLRATAVVGLGGGVLLGGLPYALARVDVLSVPTLVKEALGLTHMTSGLFGGVGYVAVFALVSHRISRRGGVGRLGGAIVATGRRSLSAYLAQSVLCAPLLAAWGLGWGGSFGSAQMALFAIGVWVVTVVASALLERAGRRGPAEVVLRRLTYRSRGGAAAPATSRSRDEPAARVTG
ncbi:DUF418 domain-containing protein [Actinoalloteichus spitiensis]|uniref:DUF418 domain-containing protein n=1 Tax=Actinoalloteichus spitiensis TaxID=252394 RepID=UPI0003698C2C|nr:DUF418 domain-containing protein [Actinoalloteichus spitiensis]